MNNIRQLCHNLVEPYAYLRTMRVWWRCSAVIIVLAVALLLAFNPKKSEAAISHFPLTSGAASNLTTCNTNNLTIHANRLVLVWIANLNKYGEAVEPTVSGPGNPGLTWVKVDSQIIIGDRIRLSLFRAMASSDQPSANLAISFSGQQTYCAWSISEYDGVATGSNGADAILQHQQAGQNDTETCEVPYDPSPTTDGSALASGFVLNGDENTTSRVGWAQIHHFMQDDITLQTQGRLTGTDTHASVSWNDNRNSHGIAVEIKAGLPSLSIDKILTNASDPIKLGSVLHYTVTATNTGEVTLTNVVVSDSKIAPGTANCASVEPGATCVLNGTYTVTQADVDARKIVNTATANSVETDPISGPVERTIITGISSPEGAKPVPSIDEWGLAIICLLLLIAGLMAICKRARQS